MRHKKCMPFCVTLSSIRSGAIAHSGGGFADYNAPTLIYNLNCTGNELSVFDCPRDSPIGSVCPAFADATVICQGTVKSIILR